MSRSDADKIITPAQIVKALRLAADQNLMALGRLPLARLMAVTARLDQECLPDGPMGRGKALYLVLQQALELLRPALDPAFNNEMLWRPYRIVKARLSGQSVTAAGRELGLTSDGFQAAQRNKAIPAFQAALWELEQQARSTYRALDLERNLPPATYTRLFGVEQPLAQVLEALADPGGRWLIAIDGLGGLGKTALAHAVARQAAQTGRFAGLAWETASQATFVWGEVRPSPRPALTLDALLEAIARQLDWHDLAALPLPARQAALADRLRRQPYLVVVDNLETAADYESLAGALWELANPTKFLLTSRQQLHSYEQVYSISLQGLPDPDGLAFIRYHGGERGIQAVAEADDATLLQIQHVTGGNPLAIKLVTGQLAHWPLRQVLADLESARTGGSADQFYQYVFNYSWKHLSPPARQLLLNMPHLATTGGEWADLQAVSGLDDETLRQAIGELTACSLLNAGGGVDRVYTIHRLTHHFLLRLEGVQAEPWHELFCAGARRAGEYALHRLRAALNRQRDNLLQAMASCYNYAQAWDIVVSCALEAHDTMVRSGHWQVWDGFLALGVDAARRTGALAEEACLLNLWGELKRRLGEWEQARVLHQAAIPILEDLEMRRGLGRAYRCLGDVHAAQGDLVAALACFERALDLLAGTEGGELAGAHLSLAGVFCHRGDYVLAREHAQTAQTLYARLADWTGEAEATVTLGLALVSSGDWEEAELCYRHALALYDQAGDDPPKVRALTNLGYLLFLEGDWSTAREHYEQALALACRVGDRPNMARLHNVIGIVLTRQERFPEALAHFEQAESAMAEIGDEPFLASVHYNVGMALLKLGDTGRARARLATALSSFEQVGDEAEIGKAWGGLGEVHAALGEWTEALACYQRALTVGERLGDREQSLAALLLMGRAWAIVGDREALASCLQRAEELAAQLKRPELQAQAAWFRAQVCAAQGTVQDAEVAYSLALSYANQSDTDPLRRLRGEIEADLAGWRAGVASP
ncbi:MAG: tetratricopeptide repeat protein [Anaerolineae bacterium]|nr:tetratricopeptide repeat protein [Anaerolineae bacterium]